MKISSKTPYTPRPVTMSLIIYITSISLLLVVAILTFVVREMDSTRQDWKQLKRKRDEEESDLQRQNFWLFRRMLDSQRVHYGSPRDLWRNYLAMYGGKAQMFRRMGGIAWQNPYTTDPDLMKEVLEIGKHRDEHEAGKDEEKETMDEAQVETQIEAIRHGGETNDINERAERNEITERERKKLLHRENKKHQETMKTRVRRQAVTKKLEDMTKTAAAIHEQNKQKLVAPAVWSQQEVTHFMEGLAQEKVPLLQKHIDMFNGVHPGGASVQTDSSQENPIVTNPSAGLPAVPMPAVLPQPGAGFNAMNKSEALKGLLQRPALPHPAGSDQLGKVVNAIGFKARQPNGNSGSKRVPIPGTNSASSPAEASERAEPKLDAATAINAAAPAATWLERKVNPPNLAVARPDAKGIKTGKKKVAIARVAAKVALNLMKPASSEHNTKKTTTPGRIRDGKTQQAVDPVAKAAARHLKSHAKNKAAAHLAKIRNPVSPSQPFAIEPVLIAKASLPAKDLKPAAPAPIAVPEIPHSVPKVILRKPVPQKQASDASRPVKQQAQSTQKAPDAEDVLNPHPRSPKMEWK